MASATISASAGTFNIIRPITDLIYTSVVFGDIGELGFLGEPTTFSKAYRIPVVNGAGIFSVTGTSVILTRGIGATTNVNPYDLVFSQDQRVDWKVQYWDTPYCTESAGIEFALFDILNTPNDSARTAVRNVNASSKEALESLLNNRSVTRSVLDYSGGSYRTGVVPSVYSYWGAGTPLGGKIAKQVMLKYAGRAKESGNVTFVFCGQGKISVFINGASALVGEVKEPLPRVTRDGIPTYARAQTEGGYAFLPVTINKGDLIEIYYWHNGEPWGGIACKVLPYKLNEAYDQEGFRYDLAGAYWLSASFMGKEASGNVLAATEIPYVVSAQIGVQQKRERTLEFVVPLTTADELDGYRWDEASRALICNADDNIKIQEERLVRFSGGYAYSGDMKDSLGNIDSTLWPRVTGHVRLIKPSSDNTQAVVECGGFEGKILDVFDKNFPDKLSYHANGYIYREGSAEPVWDITAFDNWPIEIALAELMARAGIDSKNLGRSPVSPNPEYGKRKAVTATGGVEETTETLFSMRALADASRRVQIERNTEYGNVGVMRKDYLPDDAKYLFVPEITNRVYDKALEIADHYGLDFFFNAEGQAVLRLRNNPNAFVYGAGEGIFGTISVTNTNLSDSDLLIHPSAVGAKITKRLNNQAAFSKVITGTFSRLDLYTGIGQGEDDLNGGIYNVVVERWDTDEYVLVSEEEYTSYYNGPEKYQYDDFIRADGTNACILTIMQGRFDRYKVTITPGGKDPRDTGSVNCAYRLNGIAVFYHDPLTSSYPEKISTLINAQDLSPEADKQDQRNHVIVVGARRATVTDSAKFLTNTNPNNPGVEFHVSASADPYSVYDPTVGNFIGAERTAVVFDSKVSDSDFAKWLSRTILYRYRIPSHTVPVNHTAIPMLEFRDPIHVEDPKLGMVDQVCWVQGFSETWEVGRAVTRMDMYGRVEVPSYQPREDADIDNLTGGIPAINVEIDYLNLYGEQVKNTDLASPVVTGVTGTYFDLITNATSMELSREAMPETIAIRGQSIEGLNFPRILINTPYRHFYNIAYDADTHLPTLTWNFQEGDGSDVYTKDYYEFPDTGAYEYNVHYKYFGTRIGKNPFYDPYTSEFGNLIKIKFDALVSGRYRVSIWDAIEGGQKARRVAWLTAPDEDPASEHAHWVYREPGVDVEFTWDGVDNIGEWNFIQSDSLNKELSGSFGEEPLTVGAGFYAWNSQSTRITTQIGDAQAENYAPESGDGIDSRNACYPYFTIGRYGKFLVKIEVLNDRLFLKDRADRKPNARLVDTSDLSQSFNSHEETYIWTHLGEPNRCTIAAQEWDEADYGDWSEGTTANGWRTLASYGDASIRNGKPVRFTFLPVPRPGVMFDTKREHTSGLLTRQVHLKTITFDQFWTFYKQPWSGILSENAAIDEKRLTSRMYHNEEHTIEFADGTFRTGEEIMGLEWIFQPSMFKKDFGTGLIEELEYGDYEQLETLPGYNPRNSGGTNREDSAYINLAYMSYLFYMSAHMLDRSGRRQWCLNDKFVDKSKIVTPAWRNASYDANDSSTHVYAVGFVHRGADRYLRRSIFVREWRDSDWNVTTAELGGRKSRTVLSPVLDSHPGTEGIGSAGQRKFVQQPISAFAPSEGTFSQGSSYYNDQWLIKYGTNGSKVNQDVRAASDADDSGKTLDMVLVNTDIVMKSLGSWDFRRGDQEVDWFYPSPARDFHPYYRFPVMPDWAVAATNLYVSQDAEGPIPNIDASGGPAKIAKIGVPGAMNILEIPSSQSVKALRDPGAQENWFGYTTQHAHCESTDPGKHGVRLEKSVKGYLEKLKDNNLNVYFDYVKQDDLDRFDQFRGVLSRGAYQDRNEEYAGYWDPNKRRVGAVQPVKASGVYLINLGNYPEYIVSPVNDHSSARAKINHFVPKVNDFYDIRYRHEYVWYSDRHFPVDSWGSYLYGLYQNEYASIYKAEIDDEYIRDEEWYQSVDSGRGLVLYDAGAWAGWKDDIKPSDWVNDPKLHWRENMRSLGQAPKGGVPIGSSKMGRSGGQPYLSGGHKSPAGISGPEISEILWMGKIRKYTAANIFDHGKGEVGFMRLAVGPRVPETRTPWMNLCLPTKLKG